MRKLILIAILIALLPTLSVQAQVAADSTKHFEKNGLEFDYPSAWKLTQGAGEHSQYAELLTEDKTTQLIVSWQFGAVLDCEWESTRIGLTQTLVERIASSMQTTAPPKTSWQETQLEKTRTDQIRLSGQMNNTPVVADIYSLAVKGRFLNLVYLRVAGDETANSAWETIRTTLKLAPPAPVSKEKKNDILNGKALRMPRPIYPEAARTAHASGVVVIQIVINETGSVIAACPLSGHPLLRDPSLAAAWAARFSPTKVSGKPVQVTGVITYNFVIQ